jgi:hypothetical protein
VLLGALYRAGRQRRGVGGGQWSLMERRFRALNPHRGGGEMEGQCHYGRGSAGGVAWDVEAALGVTAAGWMVGGGTASDRRREMKEEWVEWAAKAGWAG